jgi:hypothetical protein
MADDAIEDSREFEQVLTRLDALMKRSHGPAAEEIAPPPAVDDGIPVLTEIYAGEVTASVITEQDDELPVLTEVVAAQQPLMEDSVADEEKVDVMPEPSREALAEGILAELMPMMREMIACVLQEELHYAQQTLMAKLAGEAERVLRQRLLQESKPK